MNIRLKAIVLIFSGLCSLGSLNGQTPMGVTHSGQSTSQAPFPLTQYTELKNPAPTDEESWKGLSGTRCAWGNTYTRYKKEVNPRLNQKKIDIKGWKGERVTAQLVVSSAIDLENVSVEIAPLTHSSGKQSISADRILKGFVRYVMTDELNKNQKGTCGPRPDLSQFDSTLVADPIDHLAAALSIKAKTSQGYWIRVWIPEDAISGNYSSDVLIKNNQEVIGKLKLTVQVQQRTLPQPDQWAFHLDLWQNPFAVARYHQVPLWSEEHFRILKTELQPYAEAGGKVITVPIMHHPWGGQTYDPYETMITWVRKIDGSWWFDYTIFDKWVEFMMDMGVKKEIGCYSMIPWKLSFLYFDQATNSMKELKSKPGEQAYHDLWLSMLKDFAAHLKSKGWFDITHIAMDERPMPDMLKALKIIREADPDFKVSLAGSLHKELSDELNDYCIAIA